jgi:hypothetical protein
MEAAALVDSGRHRRGGIVVLDQVNPFPFMLGWPPPRGGHLWSGPGAPVRPAAEVFAEADHVLIPKFSTYSAWTEQAQLEYGMYLSQNFPASEETPSWTVLSREGAVTTPPGVTRRGARDVDPAGNPLARSARVQATSFAAAADPIGDDDDDRGDANHGEAEDSDGADIAALLEVEDQD